MTDRPPADSHEGSSAATERTRTFAGAELLRLTAENMRLRQGLWDCAIRTGMDNDGDETPEHLAYPDIVTLALREVERLRADYDALIEGGYDRG